MKEIEIVSLEEDFAEILRDAWPRATDARINDIAGRLKEFLPTYTGFVVPGARCTVETVCVYGLVIQVDANGRAVDVCADTEVDCY
jgi:hypothetical protein